MSKDAAKPGVVERVSALVEPAIAALGYELVRVHMSGSQHQTLQIMAERADRRDMTIEDCTSISHHVSALLDVEDPIAGAYSLEVSSPGLDRPLTRPQDYTRFAGYEVTVETQRPVDGRKRFRGKLIGLEGETISMTGEKKDEIFAIPLGEVTKAKLVLTKELMAAALRAQEAADLEDTELEDQQEAV